MRRSRNKNGDIKNKSGIVETILYYDAYDQRDGEIALAAASDSIEKQPLRFSSADGTMILREFPGTGASKTRYQLIADNQNLTRNAEVIMGQSLF